MATCRLNMSIQICRLLELALRSPCCPAIRSQCCLPKTILVANSVPGVPVLHKRAYSLESRSSGPARPKFSASSQQPCAERMSNSSALTHRNLSALALKGQRLPLCHFDSLDLGEVKENVRRARTCKKGRRFLVDPDLATLVADHLGPDLHNDKTIIFECHPGPGVLTKTLLNAGAQSVVALEPNKTFLTDLQELECQVDGRLKVVHCDFFKLDAGLDGNYKPPVLSSERLFSELGITKANWMDDIPVKVVGILPQRLERANLLKFVYNLLEQLSFYRYGRVELNLFISEKEYLTLVTLPGNMMHYRPGCVLWQIACDIELLHKVPWESFVSSKQSSPPKGMLPNDHMCLVRLTPRANLFSGGLTPANARTLMVMIKQCLAKRKVKLIDRLNLWSPDSGSKLLSELALGMDILTGQVFPHQYLQLFQLMDKSQEFAQSWLYDEIMENTEIEKSS
ncbi:dimethyladenosine transferase 2, mitochondrial [Entelurus aequoreus]|uniref:dimethyladenosine transferase 2, mitochondrial n=1 Tax=Entelurus aequoreus TaxID=161455 RepID=UPI002B1E4BA2|nr:dimethyladenosine transferase 2, mitochondrial [Entelurus aequoreus]XP_061881891.1 dimethyladenosine transferase 2, mitochondrial [Entelurus aequoreus]